MRVEIPERDVPHWGGVVGVAALALGVGLAIAAWGTTRDERGPASTEAPERPAPPAPDAPEEPEAVEGPEVVAPEPIADEPEPIEAPQAEAPSAEPVVSDPVVPEPPPAPVDPAGLRVRRGRIAYLRCDAASGTACARDEVMEQAVWGALEGLVACASGPRAPGHADLRLDYQADAAPVVEWRDTYADEVARLDRDAVLGCMSAPLAATRKTIATERLLVSFRFSVE